MSEFLPFDRVIWQRIASGGYGFCQRIPAVVVRATEKRVTIEVELSKGGTKRVSVRPVHLTLDAGVTR